jgi:ABC-2 type transport system permease protein
MSVFIIGPLVVIFLAVRLWRRRRNRLPAGPARPSAGLGRVHSDIGLVAARELRERFRGRLFRVGTLLILAVVAGAIVIPTLTKGKAKPVQVGLVGSLPTHLRSAVVTSGKLVGTSVHFVAESGTRAARAGLRAGHLDMAIVDGRELLVNKPISSNDTSTGAQFVEATARELGVAEAEAAAHLSAAQAGQLSGAQPLPVHSVQSGGPKAAVVGTSVVGLILTFIMLSQYNTWILIGVMEEKSSRVIEVLLAAVRPMQLLTGKVLGIGLVAFTQAFLIVAFALVLAKGVGSDILHGTAPLVLVSTLVWLVLGYAFYCWVYAAAGSTVERQDQVQTLAFPLTLPIIFGYIFALTTASSGNPSTFFDVLAYIPLTAPFAMPVLVSLSDVTLWQFLLSALISVACTFGMARLATNIYRRAILRTGRRVRLREVFSGATR